MIGEGLVIDAVVPFSTMSGNEIDSSPYRISLCGTTDERATALLRLERQPALATDVVDATGEIVTRVGLVFMRWELRHRHDDTLVVGADMSPIAVRPLTPFPCVVRLFGCGAKAAFAG